MSWEAVRWAMDQDPGSALDKWVLVGTCNFANKRTGKIYATAQTVADFCNLDRLTVRNSQRKSCDAGFLIDTGERTGGNGRVLVFLPGWSKETTSELRPPNRPSLRPPNRPSSDKLSLSYVQSTSKLRPPHRPSFIAGVGLNPEPGTMNPDDDTKALDNSLASGEGKAVKSSSSNLDYPSDPKYPEFERWCKSVGGSPTKKGFETWLPQQAPERPKPESSDTAAERAARQKKAQERYQAELAASVARHDAEEGIG
jgi:hypothetical protein